MTLQEVKEKLAITTFELRTATDADQKETDWMRHWDNDNRISVSIHKELVAELKADATINSLALQTESRTGEQGPYMSYRIVKYTPAEIRL